MKTYQKISNIFKFDEKYREIVGLNEPYKTLKDIVWQGTEKVDGTNIRVYWDGHKIDIAGRTDNAQFQGDSKIYLCELFLTDQMEYVFEQMFDDKEVYIFGECYGPKIQTGGGLYASSPKFIVFDVEINGYALSRDKVNEIASKLGLDSVPVVFEGNLDEAIQFVNSHPASTLNAAHEMEGIVLQPKDISLFDEKGNPIKCKCKYRDIVKGAAK